MDSFRLFLLRRGIKESTVARYLETLKRVPLAGVDSYLLQLVDQRKKPNYLNNIVTSLRLYGKFTQNNELATIPFFRAKPTEKGILSEEEINAIIILPPPKTMHSNFIAEYKKKTLLWKCCAYTGARVGEIAAITVSSVDLGRMVIRVDGKTGVRSIPINPILVDDLTAHIKQLKGDLLFPGIKTNQPINRAGWNFDFRARLKRLSIRRPRITPHSLRHTFITRMLDEDVNLFAVQNIVGHSKADTTQQYYHYGMKKGQAAIRKDPLGRKQLSYTERYYAFREGVRKLLADYCTTPQEEDEMIQELLKSN